MSGRCIFCGEDTEVLFKGKFVCLDCARELMNRYGNVVESDFDEAIKEAEKVNLDSKSINKLKEFKKKEDELINKAFKKVAPVLKVERV